MFLYGAVIDSERRSGLGLSRIESTPLGVVARVQAILRQAKATFVALGNHEQFLRMFVDAT